MCLQDVATPVCPEPEESSRLVSLISFLILSVHLHLDVSSRLYRFYPKGGTSDIPCI
jgi:hypothetical protein